eukprot:SAG22_NODE_342_length_11973_cov_10.127927_2_plen_226_part_00
MVLLGLLLCTATATAAAQGSTHSGPIPLAIKPVAQPSAAQLAWQDLEVSAMLGWNLQTICLPCSSADASPRRCQASSRTEGALCVPSRDYIKKWDPSQLDTDEWVKVAKSFGAKYIIAVADHMTGFTYWCACAECRRFALPDYRRAAGASCSPRAAAAVLLPLPLPLPLPAVATAVLRVLHGQPISLSASAPPSLLRRALCPIAGTQSTTTTPWRTRATKAAATT